MQCAICFRAMDASKDAYVASKQLYMVNDVEEEEDKLVVAHLMCWVIRQTVSEDGTGHCKRAVTRWRPEKKGKCHVCLKAILEIDSVVKPWSCVGAGMHLSCASMIGNIRRNLLCEHCMSKSQSKHDPEDVYAAMVDKWTGLPTQATYESVPMNKHTYTYMGMPVPVSTMIERKAQVKDILASTTAWRDYDSVFMFKTAAKELCHELACAGTSSRNNIIPPRPGDDVETSEATNSIFNLKPSQISPVCCMLRHKYLAEEMISLGLTFGMLFESSKDWSHVLNRGVFTVNQLCKLHITFTRLLLAGMEMTKFVAAGYTLDELIALRFNVCGFLAAGGTRAQLEKLVAPLTLDRITKQSIEIGLSDIKLNDIN